MDFVAKFKEKNKHLAPSSTKTYLFNIRRLAKIAGKKSLPKNGRWLLTKKLVGIVKALPLYQSKPLVLAAQKALGTYGLNAKVWKTLMVAKNKEYDTMREQKQKTGREKRLWIDYKKVFPAGKKLWDALPKQPWNSKQFLLAQKAYLVMLYGKHTPRLLINLLLPGKDG